MSGGKVERVLQENLHLKEELGKLIGLIKENEAKNKSLRFVEELFLMSSTYKDIDDKPLPAIEELFELDNVVMFIDKDVVLSGMDLFSNYKRIKLTDSKTLKYAYINRRPYYGNYIDGLISEFRIFNNIGSYLIAPIVDNNRIVASLNMYSKDPERISEDAGYDFITDLCSRIHVSIRNIRDRALLLKERRHSSFYQLCHDDEIKIAIDKFIDQLMKQKLPFSIFLIDISIVRIIGSVLEASCLSSLLYKIAEGIKFSLPEDGRIARCGEYMYFVILNHDSIDELRVFINKINNMVNLITESYPDIDGVRIGGTYGYFTSFSDLSCCTTEDIIRKLYEDSSVGKTTFTNAFKD